MKCRVRGCSNPVLQELQDSSLCLDHFLDDIEDRTRSLNRKLEGATDKPLGHAALRFAMVTAAKIATIGIHHPPEERLVRGRLLNALLLLTDLRDRAENRGD